ncbi:MAG TPA: hypothetical protein VKQ36_10745 [Ktedonobacterales bacterium]|nr:hypothetical protein [Ktedonobacterales bacterium]
MTTTNDANDTDLPIVPPAVPDALTQTSDWVVGVVDDPAEATRAYQALCDAGFAESDLLLLHGADAVQAFQDKVEHENPLMRLLHSIIGQGNDVSSFEQDYRDEASMGHSILNVYAPDPEAVARARQLIEAYGGHRLKHYGRWVISQLSKQERDLHEPQAAPLLEDGELTSQGQGNLPPPPGKSVLP